MSKPLRAYTALVSAVGGALVLWALAHLPPDWPGLLALAALTVLGELASVKLFETSRSRVSVSCIVALAGMMLYGPLGGVLVHAVSGIATGITTALEERREHRPGRAPLVHRTAFNVGMFATSVAAAGLVYGAAGGRFGRVTMASNLAPLLAAVATDYVANMGLLLGVIGLQTGRSPLQVWREEYAWGAPLALLASVGGGAALALGYDYFKFMGLAVFGLPVLLIRYSYWLYVQRAEKTKVAMEMASAALDRAMGTLSQGREALAELVDTVNGGVTSNSLSKLADRAARVGDSLAAEVDRLEVLRG